MIGLDTNVLIRYIVQDHPRQSKQAAKLVEHHCSEDSPGFISQLVLAEMCWVLSVGYGYQKTLIAELLSRLLTTKELKIERAQDAWAALQQFKIGNADYADYLIAQSHHSAGCETTYTFDRKAAKSTLHTAV